MIEVYFLKLVLRQRCMSFWLAVRGFKILVRGLKFNALWPDLQSVTTMLKLSCQCQSFLVALLSLLSCFIECIYFQTIYKGDGLTYERSKTALYMRENTKTLKNFIPTFADFHFHMEINQVSLITVMTKRN